MLKKFKLPEKVVYHIRVDAFSATGCWSKLTKLSNEKKSPIGYKPFALACIKYNQPKAEVERYVDRIESKEDKFDLYIDLELWSKAVDAAYRLKDPMRLQEVYQLHAAILSPFTP